MQPPTLRFPRVMNSPGGVVYDMPFGDPDPTQECPVGPDTRKRVRRESAPTSLCFYIAAQRLRTYIGPIFCSPLKYMEKKDQALNQMLAKQVLHEATLVPITEMWKHGEEFLMKMNKTAAQQTLNGYELLLGKLETHQNSITCEAERASLILSTKLCIQAIQDFLAQSQFVNFCDYFLDLKLRRRSIIQMKFLETIGLEKGDIYQNLFQFCHANQAATLAQSVEKLECIPVQLSPLVEETVALLAAQHFGLKCMRWQPTDPFEVLLDQMRNKGPACVNLNIGRNMHVVAAKPLGQKWGQREVFGWPIEDKTFSKSLGNHVVLLVGAIVDPTHPGGGYVLSLDPRDVSDPDQPLLERMIRTSYKALRESALPFGVLFQGKDTGTPVAYAWQSSLETHQIANFQIW